LGGLIGKEHLFGGGGGERLALFWHPKWKSSTEKNYTSRTFVAANSAGTEKELEFLKGERKMENLNPSEKKKDEPIDGLPENDGERTVQSQLLAPEKKGKLEGGKRRVGTQKAGRGSPKDAIEI